MSVAFTLNQMIEKKNARHITTQKLDELHMSKTLYGYDSISEVIVILQEHPEYTCNIYETVFEQVGKMKDKTGACIERQIRYALEATWLNSSSPKLYEWYGDIIDEVKGRPTAARFLKRTLDIVEKDLRIIERDE